MNANEASYLRVKFIGPILISGIVVGCVIHHDDVRLVLIPLEAVVVVQCG